jgi:dihydropyrimidinase
LPVIFEGGVNKGIISLNRFVELVSTAPAKIFGLFPQKGSIAVGSDADIILFDPKEKNILSASNHQSNVDYTLYEGMEINGKIKKVFLRGMLIVENDKWLGKYTYGKYLKRSETCQI